MHSAILCTQLIWPKQQIYGIVTTMIINLIYTLIHYQYFIILFCLAFVLRHTASDSIFSTTWIFSGIKTRFFSFKAGGLDSAEKTHTLRTLLKKNLATSIETKCFHAFPGQHQEAERYLLAAPLLPLFPGTIIFPQSGDRAVTQNPLLSLSHAKGIIQSSILAIATTLKDKKL